MMKWNLNVCYADIGLDLSLPRTISTQREGNRGTNPTKDQESGRYCTIALDLFYVRLSQHKKIQQMYWIKNRGKGNGNPNNILYFAILLYYYYYTTPFFMPNRSQHERPQPLRTVRKPYRNFLYQETAVQVGGRAAAWVRIRWLPAGVAHPSAAPRSARSGGALGAASF